MKVTANYTFWLRYEAFKKREAIRKELTKIQQVILAFTPSLWYNTDMENNKRTRRTPEQLIADAQSRLDKLQAKAAESEAASNPLLAPLLDEIKDVEKAELMARKGFSKGPQNFDERIAKAQARIVKIEDSEVRG